MSEPEQPHSEGAPEWMVSYADMITILMSFFVVMFSMAGSKDKKKEEPVMTALRRQFGRFVGVPSAQLLPAGSPLSAKTNGLKANPAIHDSKTLGLVGDHSARRHDPAGRPVDDRRRDLFQRANDRSDRRAASRIASLAKELAGKPQKIEVRGHTRNRPFPPDDKIHDNWDLAYERCHNTMEYLVLLGIDPARIRIGVSAQFEPLVCRSRSSAVGEKQPGRGVHVERVYRGFTRHFRQGRRRVVRPIGASRLPRWSEARHRS